MWSFQTKTVHCCPRRTDGRAGPGVFAPTYQTGSVYVQIGTNIVMGLEGQFASAFHVGTTNCWNTLPLSYVVLPTAIARMGRDAGVCLCASICVLCVCIHGFYRSFILLILFAEEILSNSWHMCCSVCVYICCESQHERNGVSRVCVCVCVCVCMCDCWLKQSDPPVPYIGAHLVCVCVCMYNYVHLCVIVLVH